MKCYLDYFAYVLEHKKNVFKVAAKKGMWGYAITHDLNKFKPSQFIPMAVWFYSKDGRMLEEKHDKAFLESGLNETSRRYLRNREGMEMAFIEHYSSRFFGGHHYERWNGKVIPMKHIKEMIVDWEAMSLKFGGSACEYYLKNYHQMELHRVSRHALERELGLLDFFYRDGLTLHEIVNYASEIAVSEVIKPYLETKAGCEIEMEWLYGVSS